MNKISWNTFKNRYNNNILKYVHGKNTVKTNGDKFKEEFLVLRSRDMGRSIAVRRWTNTALECYKRGCVCEGCFYTDFFNGTSQKCQMKASVLELVRVLGKPNVEIQQVLVD